MKDVLGNINETCVYCGTLPGQGCDLLCPGPLHKWHQANMTVINAVERFNPSHVFALFSGGHDSLTSTAIAAHHPRFSAAVHINTGIGIEETREFVREACRREGWPLIEMHPDQWTYDQLVMQRGGFPSGPKSHSTMYYFLKQRQVRRLVREHKTGIHDRILLVTGIRIDESTRRMGAGLSIPVRREGGQVWVNPILDWSARDCSDFIEETGLARNPVSDLLHRSGECLCGAFARANEIREIELWFPRTASRIHELEGRAAAAGLKSCVWASRVPGASKQIHIQHELCASCELDAL